MQKGQKNEKRSVTASEALTEVSSTFDSAPVPGASASALPVVLSARWQLSLVLAHMEEQREASARCAVGHIPIMKEKRAKNFPKSDTKLNWEN